MARTDYTSRDFEALETALRSYLSAKYPDISLPWETMAIETLLADIALFLADNCHFYIDNAFSEFFIDTVQERDNMSSLGSLVGYVMTTRSASSADLEYNYVQGSGPASIILAAGTAFPGTGGWNYITVEDHTLQLGGAPFTVYEGKFVTDIFAAQNIPYQVIVSSRKNAAHNVPPLIMVGAVTWTTCSNLLDEGTSNVCELKWRKDDTFSLRFGDGVHGNIPVGNISVRYLETSADLGNIEGGLISGNYLQSGVTIEYNNPSASSGGMLGESIANARRNIPAHYASIDRYVSASDLLGLIQAQAGVKSAFVRFDPITRLVTFYVLGGSVGGAPANITEGQKASFFAVLDDKKQIGIDAEIEDVEILDAVIKLKVYINRDHDGSTMLTTIMAAITTFFQSEDNSSVGESVKVSDFYHFFDALDGVSYLDIEKFTRLPVFTTENWSGASGTDIVASEINIYPSLGNREYIITFLTPLGIGTNVSGSFSVVRKESDGSLVFDGNGYVGNLYTSSLGDIDFLLEAEDEVDVTSETLFMVYVSPIEAYTQFKPLKRGSISGTISSVHGITKQGTIVDKEGILYVKFNDPSIKDLTIGTIDYNSGKIVFTDDGLYVTSSTVIAMDYTYFNTTVRAGDMATIFTSAYNGNIRVEFDEYVYVDAANVELEVEYE